MKKRPSLLICLLTFVLLVSAGSTAYTAPKKGPVSMDSREFARARVVKIEKRVLDVNNPSAVEIRVHLLMLNGPRKGQSHVSLYRGENDLPRDMFYRQGDTVLVGISRTGGADSLEYVSIYDVDNTTGIVILGVLLVLTIVVVGRLRGVLSMLSLTATVFLVFYVLIPMTMKGYSPLPVAVIISVFSIILSVPIIMGFQKKTAAAIGGAVLGVILATCLSLLSGWLMHLSGIVTNEMVTVFYASNVEINLHGLALSGMVIAALGAIMDVCISIASATEEIFRVNPDITVKDAFRSVFTVSSDILGATVNTLLFAYVGSALPLVLLIAMRIDPGTPFWLILNYNPVLSELVKSAVGCIGMFLSMPASAFLCIELHRWREKKNPLPPR